MVLVGIVPALCWHCMAGLLQEQAQQLQALAEQGIQLLQLSSLFSPCWKRVPQTIPSPHPLLTPQMFYSQQRSGSYEYFPERLRAFFRAESYSILVTVVVSATIHFLILSK